MKQSSPPEEWELRQISRQIEPPSEVELATEMAKRIAAGELKIIYRIVSRKTGTGIGEYTNPLEIPSDIFDDTADVQMHVEPQRDVEIVYQAG